MEPLLTRMYAFAKPLANHACADVGAIQKTAMAGPARAVSF